MAEMWTGYGCSKKNLVMLSICPFSPVDSLALGSGIGGAVIVDGKLVHGGSGWAGEPGHQVPFLSPRCHFLDLPARWYSMCLWSGWLL